MKKPNTGFTRVVLGFNISNSDICVKTIIDDWLHDINLPRDAIGGVAYETEEEMVGGLYMDWQHNYNDDDEVAINFMDELGYNIEYIKAIDELYKWWCWKGGVETYHKNSKCRLPKRLFIT